MATEIKEGEVKDSEIKESTRVSWDEYFKMLVDANCARSASKKLKVGAVIAIENRVVASGYNGFFAGAPHVAVNVDGHEVNTVHAEQNAICYAARYGVSINGGTIYISHYPCINCAKIIIASGIVRVRYYNDYNNSPIVADMFTQNGIKVDGPLTAA